MEPSFDIDPIILKYVRDRLLSADEAARLRQWLAESEDRRELIERIKNDPDWVQAQLLRMEQVDTEAIWSKVESRTFSAIPLHTRRRRWTYVAAASIIVLASGGWFWLSRIHKTAP